MADVRIAVVTPLFPVPGEPYRGKPIYQTVQQLQKLAEVEVFCPVASYPKWFRPVQFLHRDLEAGFSPPDMRTHYFGYPALPLITRPWNGRSSGRRLLP